MKWYDKYWIVEIIVVTLVICILIFGLEVVLIKLTERL